MRLGWRRWWLRKLAEWLEPPLTIKKSAVVRRQFAPERERKMRHEIRRRLKEKAWALNLNLESETQDKT